MNSVISLKKNCRLVLSVFVILFISIQSFAQKPADWQLEKMPVALETDFDAGLPLVSGDRVQLQQVILNLILNATDAMSALHERPRNLLIATSTDEAKHVWLSVRDSGVSIDPQNIEKLFNAFYTTKSHGMGMGLSISRSIIESHHGRLWASANDGPGATFSFSIPCRSESAPGR